MGTDGGDGNDTDSRRLKVIAAGVVIVWLIGIGLIASLFYLSNNLQEDVCCVTDRRPAAFTIIDVQCETGTEGRGRIQLRLQNTGDRVLDTTDVDIAVRMPDGSRNRSLSRIGLNLAPSTVEDGATPGVEILQQSNNWPAVGGVVTYQITIQPAFQARQYDVRVHFESSGTSRTGSCHPS